VWVGAHDRAGLERLARYVLRPPFVQERLRSDGRVSLELKQAWHNGTRELVFEPLELLERLAAMTPRPETNLLICHGVLAPREAVTLCILFKYLESRGCVNRRDDSLGDNDDPGPRSSWRCE